MRKMTSMPAQHFGLSGRGLVHEGYFADLCVFAYDKLETPFDLDRPRQYTRGWIMCSLTAVWSWTRRSSSHAARPAFAQRTVAFAIRVSMPSASPKTRAVEGVLSLPLLPTSRAVAARKVFPHIATQRGGLHICCARRISKPSLPPQRKLFRDAASLKATMQGYRREFHRNPELSMQEFGTCHRIKQILSNWG